MKLTKHVSYIGVQEPGRRNFDIIMDTDYGTGYNSFLVTGEKTAVIDTVPAEFAELYIEKLKQMLPASGIDYVILNHAEPDHAGSLSALLAFNPDIEVYSTAGGVKNAGAITNTYLHTHIVKSEETLDLGDGVVLTFLPAADLPWPDTMFTYLEKEEVLFSCDVFGTHICEPAVLDRHIQKADTLRRERQKCFERMFAPFKRQILDGMEQIKDKKIRMICPGHGPILQKYAKETMDHYRVWATEIPLEDFVGVFYTSAYGYTAYIAERLARELRGEGIPVKVYDVQRKDKAELEAALSEAKGILIGSPTIHKDAAKPIWDLISCAKPITLNSKVALTFGSYGWSGEACRHLNERLRALNYRVIGEGLNCILKPSPEDKRRIGEAAREFAAVLAQ